MCDYSLELYKSRPAETGESLTTHRFPSGTIGVVGSDPEVACCVAPGSTLILSGITETVQRSFGIGPVEEVVMARLDVTGHAHRDAVRFSNGKEVLLQSLNAGITVQVTGMSPELSFPESDAERPALAELIG